MWGAFGCVPNWRSALECGVSCILCRSAVLIAASVVALSLWLSAARADGGDVKESDTVASDNTVVGDDGDAVDGDPASIAAKYEPRAAKGAPFTIEGLVLARDKIGNFPLTTLGDGGPTTFVKFDSSELEGDDFAPGIRGTLQGSIFDQAIELSAFYINPIGIERTKFDLGQGNANPADTDMIYDNAPGADVSSVNSDDIYGLVAHHETALYGAEVNAIRPFGIPGLLVGARGIFFGETFSTTTIDTPNDVPGGSSTARDHVTIGTDNRLVGLQLGLQHMFDLSDGLRVGGSIKAGLYNNYVDRNRTFLSENRPDLRSFERNDSDNVFAQAVEFNPRIELKLSDSVFLTAAGTFMWLNNVSTALPHYRTVTDLNGDHDVRANDDVFFYGGSLGLTFQLDAPSAASGGLLASTDEAPFATEEDIDDRLAALEDGAALKGNRKFSLEISGSINRMFLAWDDGEDQDVYVVDNTAARSRFEFRGAVKIARGWSAGYILSVGLDDTAANDVDQFTAHGEEQIETRHSAWWVRNNQLGTMTVGYTSTATDNIIHKDVGGIMAGAANIATIGGSFLVRRAGFYEQGDDALVNSGAFTTTLNDFSAGASVDTLRRNNIRYDAPRISSQWGNFDASVAWGEDDFWDAALEYGINYNDWKFRFGAGYLHDTDEGGRANSSRDREEYKGSASLLHIPSGLFGTVAYVHRMFNGFDAATPQAVFGENTVGLVTPPGSNRPPIDYLYTAAGMRRGYWSIGDTSVYGEFARVDDAITGLREAGLREVTDSTLTMVGAAVSQDITAAGMDVYAGFRVYSFETEGVQLRSNVPTPTSPVPLTDLVFGYAGTRIRF